jgi:hypothetical protein
LSHSGTDVCATRKMNWENVTGTDPDDDAAGGEPLNEKKRAIRGSVVSVVVVVVAVYYSSCWPHCPQGHSDFP